MNSTGDASEKHSLALQVVYANQFRNDVLSLIWQGYQRMIPKNFADSEEDDITGELKKEIYNVIQDPTSPKWVEHYFIAEQIRVNAKDRLGKRRLIIDIEFERNNRGKRPHFPFEAKRLDGSHNIGRYLGSEGLGAFLDRTYPTTHGEAGMLGYIQKDKESDWANKISEKIEKSPKKYKIFPDGQWKAYKCKQLPSNIFQTTHSIKVKNMIKVIHLLLLFH